MCVCCCMSRAFAEVNLSQRGERAADGIILENEYLRAELVPARGGRIISLIDKTVKQELVFPFAGKGGMLIDIFGEQNYPGELSERPYAFRVIEQTPQAVGIELTATLTGARAPALAGLEVAKQVWMRDAHNRIEIKYQLRNPTDRRIAATPWLQQFC